MGLSLGRLHNLARRAEGSGAIAQSRRRLSARLAINTIAAPAHFTRVIGIFYIKLTV